MASFAAVLRVLNDLKQDRVVEDYAVAGGMALAFWSEPIATYDLDVLVFLPETGGPLISLEPIYRWASQKGYESKAEHVLIRGLPVQFLPTHGDLSDEAIRTARTLDYDGVPVRVVRPEYLVALYLEPSPRTSKRRERAAALVESGALDPGLLKDLLARFNLTL